MKYIYKNVDPIELLGFRSMDNPDLEKPKYENLPKDVKDAIRDSICNEQGYICCYCERELKDNDLHIEHLKPRSRFEDLQLEYDNLLCSCQNVIKKGEPRHCGNSKNNWYKEDSIITPLDPNCADRFKFSIDGIISPVNNSDIACKSTIEKMKLDLPKLNKLREEAISAFIDEDIPQEEMNVFIEDYLKDKSVNAGKFNEFYTTIKYLASVGDI